MYDFDLYYYNFFAILATYNKYIYKYPIENMYKYHYDYFTIKPGNFTLLRHYADKDLPMDGAELFVNFKCKESGDFFSCYVCPLYKSTTTLHLLSGKGT
jgi:hypothetical protein